MTRKETAGGAGLVFGIIILTIALGFGIWGASVLLSNVTGAGNAIKQKNSAVNRIGQQERFEDLAADYDGYLVKITTAKQAVKDATPADRPFRQTELVGLRQTCVDAAQTFNANSRKYTARDWKSAGLPARLDPADCT